MLLASQLTLTAATGFLDSGPAAFEGVANLPAGLLLTLGVAAIFLLISAMLAIGAMAHLARSRSRPAESMLACLQGLLKAAGGPVVFWSAEKWPAEGKGLVQNPTPRVLGATPGDLFGGVADWSTLRTLLTSGSLAQIDAGLAELITGGVAFAIVVTRADGAWIDARGARVKDAEGRLLGHALWLGDAGAAQMREAALQASLISANAAFVESLEMAERAPFPVWRRAPALGLEWVNRAFASAVELPATEVVARDGVEFASRALGSRAR